MGLSRLAETFTGVLTELGGPELAASGNEKPRKVVIKQDPAKHYGKTFRTWSNSDVWERLQSLNGQQVTVEYYAEERQGGPNGTYTQNFLTGVLENGNGAGGGQPHTSVGEGNDAGRSPAPSPTNDSWGAAPSGWTAPQETPSTKDDYWNRREATDHERSMQMEAAWAVKAVLDVSKGEALSDDEVVQNALKLALVKRRVAFELGK